MPGDDAGITPHLVLDGRVLTRTLRKIDMDEGSLHKVQQQAASLLGEVVQVYETQVAAGEVGEAGTATASDAVVDGCPTGLLYGRIQSGKTLAMITFSAMAIDNGFRVILVLTTNFLELVRQTKTRFDDLARVLVHASTETEAWTEDVDHIRKHIGARGLVLVCAKDGTHLRNARSLLEEVGAADLPCLILDDEADQASPDANVRKRSRSEEEVSPTQTHTLIQDIRDTLRHHVFIQVTATPYALLLQNVDNPLKPKFAFLLEPGDAYRGGEDFFSSDQLEGASAPTPPIVFVPEEETDELGGSPESAPAGLERSLTFFLVSAGAQAINDKSAFRTSQNFLCHTSHRQAEHDKLQTLIRKFLSQLYDMLDPLTGRAEGLIAWAYEELKRTLPDPPPISEIVEDILDRLPRRKIRVVNAQGRSGEEVRGAPNFIIGGNIVGRGLTIPNLLVTYYLRRPRISQMDTMLQHARMFGYRANLMDYTRVFLPPSLAVRFHDIHLAEAELRELLPKVDRLEQIPVRVVGKLRATRYGVLDTGSVSTVPSGKHLYPVEPDLGMARSREEGIESLVKRLLGQDWDVLEARGPEHVSADELVKLVELFDVDRWGNQALENVIRSVGDSGWVAYRPMRRKIPGSKRRVLLTGAVSGDELREARERDEPTFMIFKQVIADRFWGDRKFWYPTLIFPASMPTQIYNNSAE